MSPFDGKHQNPQRPCYTCCTRLLIVSEKILTFEIVHLEKVGHFHQILLSQWRHSMSNVKIYTSRMKHFCVSFHSFRYINKFEIFDHDKAGQGHWVLHSQWRHSMANIKIYKHSQLPRQLFWRSSHGESVIGSNFPFFVISLAAAFTTDCSEFRCYALTLLNTHCYSRPPDSLQVRVQVSWRHRSLGCGGWCKVDVVARNTNPRGACMWYECQLADNVHSEVANMLMTTQKPVTPVNILITAPSKVMTSPLKLAKCWRVSRHINLVLSVFIRFDVIRLLMSSIQDTILGMCVARLVSLVWRYNDVTSA